MHPWLDRLLAWRRPSARLREFAETEAFGSTDLTRAASRVDDAWVRRQLVRHAEDETRHAALLGEHADARPTQPLGAALAGETESRPALDVDGLGEVGFLAFVHVSERRAAEEFARARAANQENAEVFDAILADERRHVAWTGHALERLREQGRGAEVDASLARERWRVRLLPLRWLLGRLAEGLSAVLLTGIHALVLPPFALMRPAERRGWQSAPPLDLRRES